MTRPDWLLDIPSDEYHAATKENRFLTSHRLQTFRKCPLEYRQRCTGVILDRDTEAFLKGRAVHALTLEGRAAFDREFFVGEGPVNPKTGAPYGTMTKAYAEWAAEVGRPVVTPRDFAVMEAMAAAVRAHPAAAPLLADGIAEGVVRTRWQAEGVVLPEPIQTRMDWFNPETGDLVDLKTCEDVDKFRFAVRDFGYGFQLAFYRRALALAGYAGKVACWLVAVEKREPYRVVVVRIADATVDDFNLGHVLPNGARDDNEAMLAELWRCREADVWPTRYEDVIMM